MSLSAEKLAEFSWPKKYQAAVSLSYDDALESQLNNAIPALDRHGFKGSFYLTLSNPGTLQNIEKWRSAAQNGHELGNHTIYHPCSKSVAGRDWVAPEHDLDKKTMLQMVNEVNVANGFLQALDGQKQRTLTVPCGESKVIDGDYLELVRDTFIAVKGHNPQYPKKFDLILVPDNTNAETLIKFVEEVKSQNGVANILFHGVGGDYLSVSNKAHDKLLAYLAQHKNDLWVDTYANIMAHVKEQHIKSQ